MSEVVLYVRPGPLSKKAEERLRERIEDYIKGLGGEAEVTEIDDEGRMIVYCDEIYMEQVEEFIKIII